MGKTTITEALAEIKTINARIEKKQQAVMRYFARDSRLRDPLEKEGGAAEFVRKERQAVADLQKRIVAIRCAIQRANLATTLTVQDATDSVAGWLNWRREVAPQAKAHLDAMTGTLSKIRTAASGQGFRRDSMGRQVKDESDGPVEIVVTVDEQTLAQDAEKMETVLGELDGKLSLLNATTVIEV